MHAASSTRILPQEQRSANFSTSRATVPKQHSRLKKYKHYKKISLSSSCSLPLISLCSSICLSPSLRQCENINETSAATLPITHTSLYHLHPNRQTASILSYQCILHLWSPIISHPCFHLWYVYRKPPHTQYFTWPHNIIYIWFYNCLYTGLYTLQSRTAVTSLGFWDFTDFCS